MIYWILKCILLYSKTNIFVQKNAYKILLWKIKFAQQNPLNWNATNLRSISNALLHNWPEPKVFTSMSPKDFSHSKKRKGNYLHRNLFICTFISLYYIFTLFLKFSLFDHQNSLHTTKIQQNRGWEKEGGRTWDHLNRDSYRLPLVAWMTGNSTLSTYGKKIPPDYLNTATIHNWLSEDKSKVLSLTMCLKVSLQSTSMQQREGHLLHLARWETQNKWTRHCFRNFKPFTSGIYCYHCSRLLCQSLARSFSWKLIRSTLVHQHFLQNFWLSCGPKAMRMWH